MKKKGGFTMQEKNEGLYVFTESEWLQDAWPAIHSQAPWVHPSPADLLLVRFVENGMDLLFTSSIEDHEGGWTWVRAGSPAYVALDDLILSKLLKAVESLTKD